MATATVRFVPLSVTVKNCFMMKKAKEDMIILQKS